MYKISVPIHIDLLNDGSVSYYINELKQAGAERVFLFCAEPFTRTNSFLYHAPERMANAISTFKSEGFEVGVWMDAFGHGGVLAHSTASDYVASFTRIRGSDGREAQEGFCPLDENFRSCFVNAVQTIARMNPDIIMFDDDFRINIRQYHMGCLCDAHMKLLRERLSEDVRYEDMERLAFTGGENKYRSAWMKLMGETLLDFAHLLRRAVDEINDKIRMGACAVYTTWDFDGIDMIALSKALAGKTRPFIRTIGAPYHGSRIQYAIEHTRMQAAWCDGEDIELFAEGDVYPRPRYAVPARYLEIFDLALIASGAVDGILKYMLDYNRPYHYENGYMERHLRNADLREALADMFKGKKHVGLRIFEQMHKIEKYEFPAEYEQGIATKAWNTYFSVAEKLASENAIPTVYKRSEEYPTIVFGENARYIEVSDMKNGLIVDAVAAKILSARGFDTGLLSCESAVASGESFCFDHDEIRGISGIASQKCSISDRAIVDSIFKPMDSPASYFYENKNAQRFFVLCMDAYNSDKNNFNYFNNYYRQEQMLRAIDWLCGRSLPAVIKKQPYLYMQAAKNEEGSALSIALFNMNVDEIIAPIIALDKAYTSVKCVGCEAVLEEKTLRLKGDVLPYGMAAFELSL